MITLSIIGVVASLIIPPLNRQIQDIANETAYKKAYSTLCEAYKMAVKDNETGLGAFSGITANTNSYTKFRALKAQLNVMKECPFDSGALNNCWASSGVGLKEYTIAGPMQSFSNKSTTYNQNRNESFVTENGMFIMLNSLTATTGRDTIIVDTNGEKKPNDWGKDVFLFRMDDTAIGFYSSGVWKHNDGTIVNIAEWTAMLD